MKCIIPENCSKCGKVRETVLEQQLEWPSFQQFKKQKMVSVVCACGNRYKVQTKIEA